MPHVEFSIFDDAVTDLYDAIMQENPKYRTGVEERFIEYVGEALAAEVKRSAAH